MKEHAVTFASQSLVGVLTDADHADKPGLPAVVFLNAGMLHRVGPNRLHVRLARNLARRGFTSLRFDRSGVGDSPARTDGLPLRDAALGDVRDALDFLAAERGASSFILVGLCSGADLAFGSCVEEAGAGCSRATARCGGACGALNGQQVRQPLQGNATFRQKLTRKQACAR